MPPSKYMAKVADSKWKIESINFLIPKKAWNGLVHWTKTHCSLLQEAWGCAPMHNTHDYNWHSANRIPKKSIGSARPRQKDHNSHGVNLA
jgi:hypothetical protein